MMFNKLSIASVLALATFTVAYPNKYCSAGKYHSAQGSVLVCKDCPAGHFRQTGFSSTVPTTCDPCPAGKYQDDEGKSTCDSCRKGTFAANPGTTRCTNCPKGTFVDHTGAKGCCSCCAGYYQDNTGQDECKKCSNNGNGFRKYSAPGSDSYGDCHYQQDSDNGVTLVSGGCGMVGPGDKTCPAVLPSGPIGSQVAKKKRSVSCPSGKKACSRLAGVGGFDCVDISANVESCGGCVDYDAEGHADVGKDCTAIPGVSTAKCVKGGCVIDSCKKGFVLADDQSSCISTSPVTVQDASSRRRSRRDML